MREGITFYENVGVETNALVAGQSHRSPCTRFRVDPKEGRDRQPAPSSTVNLNGKRIRVEATAESVRKDGDQLRSLLKTKLVTLIQKDPRFILNRLLRRRS